MPFTLAAAAHAALFALFPPGAAVDAPAIDPTAVIEYKSVDPIFDPPPPQSAAGEPGGGGGEPVKALEEPMVVPNPDAMTIDVPKIPTSADHLDSSRIPRVPVPGPPGPPVAGSMAEQLFDPQSLDREPRARVRIAPEYPFDAKRLGLAGVVEVAFVVGPDGAVRDARVLRSDHRELEAAALRAVLKWRFEPGKVRGRPVAFRMNVPMVFRLAE
ncbi:MAG TPA: energy transducer TonB [Opitutaceae bacterium]|nr:energy transducer TonB [Opitutaceae bacterium]